jgi:HAD superfamily hydrolase (TIGR01509 family)
VSIARIRGARHWIFDLDGTLTVAMHDFDAIRTALDLPTGRPILEALAELPAADAARRAERLEAIELELALAARPAKGADRLLEALSRAGADLGIATRNSRANALATLRAAGLDRFFAEPCVLGRDEAAPKPRPDALHRLIDGWRGAAGAAVMVGDYLFDLQAGREAGAATVYVDPAGLFPFADFADVSVCGLDELLDDPRLDFGSPLR